MILHMLLAVTLSMCVASILSIFFEDSTAAHIMSILVGCGIGWHVAAYYVKYRRK